LRFKFLVLILALGFVVLGVWEGKAMANEPILVDNIENFATTISETVGLRNSPRRHEPYRTTITSGTNVRVLRALLFPDGVALSWFFVRSADHAGWIEGRFLTMFSDAEGALDDIEREQFLRERIRPILPTSDLMLEVGVREEAIRFLEFLILDRNISISFRVFPSVSNRDDSALRLWLLHRRIQRGEANWTDRDFSLLCAIGYPEDIKTAISYGANVHLGNEHGSTILIYLALFGGPYYNAASMISVLVENGVDVNAVDVNGRSALMFAALVPFNTSDMIFGLIENGADVNLRDNFGNMAVNIARDNSFLRNTEALKMLEELSRGARVGGRVLEARIPETGTIDAPIWLRRDFDANVDIREVHINVITSMEQLGTHIEIINSVSDFIDDFQRRQDGLISTFISNSNDYIIVFLLPRSQGQILFGWTFLAVSYPGYGLILSPHEVSPGGFLTIFADKLPSLYEYLEYILRDAGSGENDD